MYHPSFEMLEEFNQQILKRLKRRIMNKLITGKSLNDLPPNNI